MSNEAKKCPLCAEEIRAESNFCPHYWKINAYNAKGIQIAENQGYRYFTVTGP